ncbi:hypothetical protein N9112_00335 [bacterium]|nr:hypothetical protein [bacterium]
MSQIEAEYYRIPEGCLGMKRFKCLNTEFFKGNRIKVSVEDLSNGTGAVYGELPVEEFGDHPELIELVLPSRPIEEAFKLLQSHCEKEMKQLRSAKNVCDS